MDESLKSCREFTADLASSLPAPGGGGAAALCGAVGTALAQMVCSLTLGKARYAAVQEETEALTARLEELRAELLDQIAADEAGFLPLAEAYRLPKEAPDRGAILEQATADACRVPLHIMELCTQAIEAAGRIAEIGSRLALSDAGCAAATLKGALEAASLNVLINTGTLKDRQQADELNDRCLRLLESGSERAEAVFETIKNDFLNEK